MFCIMALSRHYGDSHSEDSMKHVILKEKPYTTEALSLLKQGVTPIITWDMSLNDLLSEAQCEGDENIATLDSNTHLTCTIAIGDEVESFGKRFGFSAQIVGSQDFSCSFHHLDEWHWNEYEQLNAVTDEIFEYIKSNHRGLLLPTEKNLSLAIKLGLIEHLESELNIKFLSGEDSNDYNHLRSKMDFSTLEIEREINHDEWFDEFACHPDLHIENGIQTITSSTHLTETYRFNGFELVVNTPHGVSIVDGKDVVIADSVIESHYEIRMDKGNTEETINPVVGKMLVEHIAINSKISMSNYERKLLGDRLKLQLLEFLDLPPKELWTALLNIANKA